MTATSNASCTHGANASSTVYSYVANTGSAGTDTGPISYQDYTGTLHVPFESGAQYVFGTKCTFANAGQNSTVTPWSFSSQLPTLSLYKKATGGKSAAGGSNANGGKCAEGGCTTLHVGSRSTNTALFESIWLDLAVFT